MCQNENSRSLMITSGIKLQGISDNLSAYLKDCRLTVEFPSSVMSTIINPQNWDSVFESVISGTLENQENVSLKIAVVTGYKFDFSNLDTIRVECIVSEIKTGKLVLDREGNNKQWFVRLSNVKIKRGDLSTVVPIPIECPLSDEQRQTFTDMVTLYRQLFPTTDTSINDSDLPFPSDCRWNKIIFQWNSRSWNLTDDKFTTWITDLDAITIPVISGSLVTSHQQGDTEESILESARNIALMLSFALGRDIQPCSIELKNDSETIYSHELCQYVRPFNNHGETIIDNGNSQWGGENLKKFLESAESVFNTDKEWWKKTLGFFVQGTSCFNVLELQLASLNILLDRFSSYLVQFQGKMIDMNIDKRIKHPAFFHMFHDLLRIFVSKKWTKKNSESLIYKIVEFNDHPSFSRQVLAACEQLGITAMSKGRIGFRHKLLHSADFDKKLKTLESRANYLFELHALLALMILKKLNFDGKVYLRHYGNNVQTITDILQEEQNKNP